MQSNKLSCITITFELEFSALNNRIMWVEVINDQSVHKLHPVCAGPQSLDFSVNMPATIKIMIGGKNQDHDTVIDQHGKITADLYVKFNKVLLDGIEIKIPLRNIVCLTTDSGQEFYTDYIGFNGYVAINLTETNVFDQIMAWNRL